MKRFKRISLPFLLSIGVALVSAACGSNDGSPSGPSAAGKSASISGTVQSGVSAARASIANHTAEGVRVTVVGTGISATTDSSGRFVLTDVPTGQTLSLRFEGKGLDATLSLGGLTPGQTLTITVTLANGRANLGDPDDDLPSPSPSPTPKPSPPPQHDNDGEAEFSGAIQSITPPNLMVAGRLVRTDGSTEIKLHGDRAGLGDLKVNDMVEVKGTTQADGSVLARKINVESEGGDDDDE